MAAIFVFHSKLLQFFRVQKICFELNYTALFRNGEKSILSVEMNILQSVLSINFYKILNLATKKYAKVEGS